MTEEDRADHHRVWDLLPWLANATLEGEEAAMARAHVETCPECDRELERQIVLCEIVAAADVPIPSQAYALEEISDRLVDNAPGARVRALFGRFGGLSAQGVMLGGALAAALLLGVFAMTSGWAPGAGDRFETATDPADAAAGVEIRVRFAPPSEADAIRRMLEDAGARDVSGPTETGLIRGVLSPESSDDVIERLRVDSRILFIASDP